jgi:hypothetical protein
LLVLVVLLAGQAQATPAAPRGRLNPRTRRPVVTPGHHHLTPAELRALAEKHGLAQVEKAVSIAQRESAGVADVVVDTRGMSPDELRAFWGRDAAQELSVGLWQINLLANHELVPGDTTEAKAEALKDPDVNASVAARLSHGGTNWAPWGA